MRKYPFIAEDRKRLQKELKEEIEAKEEYIQCMIKAQVISDMPVHHGAQDKTATAIAKLMDGSQSRIDEITRGLNELEDIRIWLDKAFAEITDRERNMLLWKYNENWKLWKIMRVLGIERRETIYKMFDEAKAKIRKIMF